MNCMKCGREIALGQAFCKECLGVMEQYPVKPDTPILLPNRSALSTARRPSHNRRPRKPEERIARLRKLVVIQTFALLLILIGFIVTVWVLTSEIGDSHPSVPPGQNYSTVETTTGM